MILFLGIKADQFSLIGFFICVKIYKRCCILNKRCYICTQITTKNKYHVIRF